MGLSASQARLLSITARLSNNELKSQSISNSKMRLADKTQEASEEYINALSATKLTYTYYDAQGNSTALSLTPSVIYEYSDLKNQYGIVNSAGQILVNSTDAKNFEASDSVNDFVQLYDCELTDNPYYGYALESIYGTSYTDYFDTDTGTPLVDFGGLDVVSWASQVNQSMSESDFNSWASQISVLSLTGEESGSYGTLVNKLSDVPEYPGDEPIQADFSTLAADYNSSACYSSVADSTSGIWHMEHNLCTLIWGIYGFDSDGDGSITNTDGTITISRDEDWYDSYSGSDENDAYSVTTGFSAGNSTTTSKAEALMSALQGYSDYDCIQEVLEYLLDLYCDVINYLNTNYSSSLDSDLTVDSSKDVKTEEELLEEWNEFYTMLENLSDTSSTEFEKKHAAWETQWANITAWSDACVDLYNEYLDDLANLPEAQIPDEDDTKTQWYVNLWHRMNGSSDYKSNDAYKNYKQLDDNLLSSEAWLKFALENGVVTLEKVNYVSEAESDTGLSTTEWKSISYSTCVDITEVEDETAIAKAEVVYNKTLSEIEAKDTKYENEIKNLDTEHSALQTEYDSVKEVISNNVERSFKAFS